MTGGACHGFLEGGSDVLRRGFALLFLSRYS